MKTKLGRDLVVGDVFARPEAVTVCAWVTLPDKKCMCVVDREPATKGYKLGSMSIVSIPQDQEYVVLTNLYDSLLNAVIKRGLTKTS